MTESSFTASSYSVDVQVYATFSRCMNMPLIANDNTYDGNSVFIFFYEAKVKIAFDSEVVQNLLEIFYIFIMFTDCNYSILR